MITRILILINLSMNPIVDFSQLKKLDNIIIIIVFPEEHPYPSMHDNEIKVRHIKAIAELPNNNKIKKVIILSWNEELIKFLEPFCNLSYFKKEKYRSFTLKDSRDGIFIKNNGM